MAEEQKAAGLRVRISQRAPITLDVAFETAGNELLALLGPSGSGKTTILRAIAGLVHPQEGLISINGEVWFSSAGNIHLTPQARAAGLVFQDYALFPHLSALENVAIAVGGKSKDIQRTTALSLLSRVNLEGLENRRPHQLSGGQRQRVALARALARNPRVLLLDEPFSAVDQQTREKLKRELAAMRTALGIPIILVTHDIGEALALADRISVLYRGRTLETGAPENMRARPGSVAVARLMGQANIFDGVVEQTSSGGQPGKVRWDTHVLDVASTGNFAAGDNVTWMVPSDSIILHRRDEPLARPLENALDGGLVEITPLGEHTALGVRVGGDHVLRFKVTTRAVRRLDLTLAAEVTVSLLADAMHLMTREQRIQTTDAGLLTQLHEP
jgi:molybdate transport system ATP-binding protein